MSALGSRVLATSVRSSGPSKDDVSILGVLEVHSSASRDDCVALLYDGSNGGEESIAVVADGSRPKATVQVLRRADANFGGLVVEYVTLGGHCRESWRTATADSNKLCQ